MKELQSYSAEERVRLELLAYPNPENLHDIERAWRDLSRKLVDHVKRAEEKIEELKSNAHKWKVESMSLNDWSPYKFPEKFTPPM